MNVNTNLFNDKLISVVRVRAHSPVELENYLDQ